MIVLLGCVACAQRRFVYAGEMFQSFSLLCGLSLSKLPCIKTSRSGTPVRTKHLLIYEPFANALAISTPFLWKRKRKRHHFSLQCVNWRCQSGHNFMRSCTRSSGCSSFYQYGSFAFTHCACRKSMKNTPSQDRITMPLSDDSLSNKFTLRAVRRRHNEFDTMTLILPAEPRIYCTKIHILRSIKLEVKLS